MTTIEYKNIQTVSTISKYISIYLNIHYQTKATCESSCARTEAPWRSQVLWLTVLNTWRQVCRARSQPGSYGRDFVPEGTPRKPGKFDHTLKCLKFSEKEELRPDRTRAATRIAHPAKNGRAIRDATRASARKEATPPPSPPLPAKALISSPKENP